MNRLIQMTLLVAVIACVAGCKPDANDAKTYPAIGIVQAIASNRQQVTIQHQAIAGYMAAMTMPFRVRDTNELNDISPGDQITFNLVVTVDDEWVENIRPTGKTGPVVKPPVQPAKNVGLGVGDPLPDYAFTDENGCPAHFSDFRGRALAFTFFFTRCPLPDYCVRMNRNFDAARKILRDETGAPTNWDLLSLSFDPGFDTPAVLKSYAKIYRGDDTNHWLFATASTNTLAALAPRVDFNFWRVDGSLAHNLRTVVIDPAGKIAAEFDGNTWTGQQLAAAIRKAAAKTSVP